VGGGIDGLLDFWIDGTEDPPSSDFGAASSWIGGAEGENGRRPGMAVGPAGKDACATSGAGLLRELVEEGVVAVVGGPDGQVMTQGDAALGGFPKEFGAGMFCEFVEADITAINGHGLGVGGKSNDSRAVIKFDDADSDFLGEAGGTAAVIHARDFQEFFVAGKYVGGEVE